MDQILRCAGSMYDHEFFSAVKNGDLGAVEASIIEDPSLLRRTTLYDRLSALHIAASSGCVEVIAIILERSFNPDAVNRCKQTPLMLAAMHGKVACVQKLLEHGANILMIDSLNGRTCLHYAAYFGHLDCLQVIISAGQSTSVVDSWGIARFIDVRDEHWETPLHLAARKNRAQCIHILLDNGALVSALTSCSYWRYPGSTALHLAACSGNIDCVCELLAWGADRHQKDASGRTPYLLALRKHHRACAALLNTSAAEPLVWPSPLKLINELDPDVKALLEAVLLQAIMERENKILKDETFSLPSHAHQENSIDICRICFQQACTIQLQDCGHQMCAHCTLALCCHNKPDPVTLCLPTPSCPFCRSDIVRLVAVKKTDKDEGNKAQLFVGENKDEDEANKSIFKVQKSKRFINLSEGGCCFMSLSSAIWSFGKIGNISSRILLRVLILLTLWTSFEYYNIHYM